MNYDTYHTLFLNNLGSAVVEISGGLNIPLSKIVVGKPVTAEEIDNTGKKYKKIIKK